MKTILSLLLGCTAALSADTLPNFVPPPSIDHYVFMEIGVPNADGTRDDGKFFLGRLPNEGEAVEMVYVGRNSFNGNMRLQLRVKTP
jgi:hypothetical protein